MIDKDMSEPNPKIDPAPNSNTEREPDDWVSGSDPMTGAQGRAQGKAIPGASPLAP
jgi:hypothetical protein